MSYICPRCGAVSQHPIDEREGYCARCRDFTAGERTAPFIARVANEAVARHEYRHHRALPNPIPPYLFPQPGPLGEGDQILTPTTDELRAIMRALDAVAPGARVVRLIHRDGSPWLEFDAVTTPREVEPFPPADAGAYGVQRFALWRYTLAVYRVGDDGAVEDDPLDLLTADERAWRDKLREE